MQVHASKGMIPRVKISRKYGVEFFLDSFSKKLNSTFCMRVNIRKYVAAPFVPSVLLVYTLYSYITKNSPIKSILIAFQGYTSNVQSALTITLIVIRYTPIVYYHDRAYYIDNNILYCLSYNTNNIFERFLQRETWRSNLATKSSQTSVHVCSLLRSLQYASNVGRDLLGTVGRTTK